MSFREHFELQPTTAIVHGWSYAPDANWEATMLTLPAGEELLLTRNPRGVLYPAVWSGWAADAIIDLYAKDLAMRRPA